MAHPNEELFRKGYQAFTSGDMDTVRGLLAEDAVWHVPGRNALAGDYRGHEQIFKLFGEIFEMTANSFQLEIHDIVANDEHAIALVTSRGQRDGKRLESRAAHVVHIRDGKVTESWWHPGDQYAEDEFWS